VRTGAEASLKKALGRTILADLIVAATKAARHRPTAPFLGSDWLGGAMGGACVLAMMLLAERRGAALVRRQHGDDRTRRLRGPCP